MHDGVRGGGPIESPQESGDRQGRYDPFANSAAIRAIKRTIDHLAATDAPVLISGESDPEVLVTRLPFTCAPAVPVH